jgi:hypothetical protein
MVQGKGGVSEMMGEYIRGEGACQRCVKEISGIFFQPAQRRPGPKEGVRNLYRWLKVSDTDLPAAPNELNNRRPALV